MLGLGWTEMLVVGVVALIVIGPKDLPVVMQRIGKFAGQIRRMGNEFQREINKSTGLDEVRNLRKSISEPLRKSTEEIRREFNAMTPNGPKPSGLIKPSDPSKESVADEIRAAAGMPKEEPKAAAPAPKSGPVKAARPRKPAKATPVPESKVENTELDVVEARPAEMPPTASEAKPARKRAVKKKAEAVEVVPVAPKRTKTAAKKPSTRKRAKPPAEAPAKGEEA